MDYVTKLEDSDESWAKIGPLRDERRDKIELSRGCSALLPRRQVVQLEPVNFLLG